MGILLYFMQRALWWAVAGHMVERRGCEPNLLKVWKEIRREMVMRGREEHTLMVCGVDWWPNFKKTQGNKWGTAASTWNICITLYIPNIWSQTASFRMVLFETAITIVPVTGLHSEILFSLKHPELIRECAYKNSNATIYFQQEIELPWPVRLRTQEKAYKVFHSIFRRLLVTMERGKVVYLQTHLSLRLVEDHAVRADLSKKDIHLTNCWIMELEFYDDTLFPGPLWS